MVKNIIISITGVLLLTSCFEEIPFEYEGTFVINLTTILQDSSLVKILGDSVVSDISVELSTIEYSVPEFGEKSDSIGLVEFTGLPWASYKVVGRGNVISPAQTDPTKMDTIPVTGTLSIIPEGSPQMIKNMYVSKLYVSPSNSQPGLKLNEIFTAGSPHIYRYFHDMFLELYNSSKDTVYMDGIVFCRMGSGQLSDVTSIFQFPGEPLIGRQYSVYPDSFLLLALDAYDHTLQVPSSVDLSGADWEFRNSTDFGDYDNLNVPNIENIEVGCNVDFFLALTSDVILIADGSDAYYLDGIDSATVIDCVEYSSKQLGDHEPEIESFLDRSWAGTGNRTYSGRSVERIEPGYDTNNSAEDFRLLDDPTPGYQYIEE